VTVHGEQQLIDIFQWAKERHVAVTLLGAGSNLLVRDGGIRGVAIKLAGDFETIRLVSEEDGRSVHLEAGAAVPVRRLGRYALERGLAGLNFALGIPGSVGGALRMNAGAWGGCMADRTTTIKILSPEGNLTTVKRSQLRFSYRKLDLEKAAIILSGEFELRRGDPKSLNDEARRMQERRKSTQPLSLPSAGSIFRNPQGEKTAGELIDSAGLKGFGIGGAEVSTKHANFIVNKGGATASDVLDVIARVQAAVSEKHGIRLEPEVTILGEEAGS
jgi:UDP-N-acetylmuramate dehydrogenase